MMEWLVELSKKLRNLLLVFLIMALAGLTERELDGWVGEEVAVRAPRDLIVMAGVPSSSVVRPVGLSFGLRGISWIFGEYGLWIRTSRRR